MKRLAINSGDAFILVYSVDDPQSFDDLEQLRQTILNEREQAYLEASASIISNDSSSGLASGASQSSLASCGFGSATLAAGPNSLAANQLQPTVNEQRDLSPSRHWSLASLFHNYHHQTNNSHHHQHHLQQHHHNPAHHHQYHPCAPGPYHQQYGSSGQHTSGHSSLSLSMGSSSCSSSADNSRRSSISAAEAALKTRRTRRPPMVIVANKQDLPKDKHLVNSDEIEALVVIDWNNGFVRASAALNWNVEEIFQQVLKQARQPPTLTEAIVSKRRKSLPPK